MRDTLTADGGTSRKGTENPIVTKKIGVMQICDSLDAGGMERVAVNVANNLPREKYESTLCTTRRDGQLADQIAPHVRRLRLDRKSTLDLSAVRRLVLDIREHRISILHAHGPSLFIATAVASFSPHPRVIWHDHFGGFETHDRSAWLYRLPARRLSGVIAVSRDLEEWATKSLGVTPARIRFIPNFVSEPSVKERSPDLPGHAGERIVCVANLRPQKDHTGVLHAMQAVIAKAPGAHLLLLGGCDDMSYLAKLRQTMEQLGVQEHVTWLGSRDDVHDVLANCDIGILGSASEGLPLALLEYGMAGLPSVATRVGQCAEVLDDGSAGLLVPPSSPPALAGAILSLLQSPGDRARYGAALRARVRARYSAREAMRTILDLYDLATHETAGETMVHRERMGVCC